MLSHKQTEYQRDVRSLSLVSHAVTSRQVGEIEEQLTSARRELARSEEANQKLQRDVKEVRPGKLLTDNKPPLRVSVCRCGTKSLFCSYTQKYVTVCYGNKAICLLGISGCYCTHKRLYPVAMATVPSVELQAFSHGCGPVNQSACWWLIERHVEDIRTGASRASLPSKPFPRDVVSTFSCFSTLVALLSPPFSPTVCL